MSLSLASPVPNSILLHHNTHIITRSIVHACLIQYKGTRLYSAVTVRNKVEEESDPYKWDRGGTYHGKFFQEMPNGTLWDPNPRILLNNAVLVAVVQVALKYTG